MSDFDSDARLSQVQTAWTIVCQAHGPGPQEQVRAAQEELLGRYAKVIQRYLLGALRDPDAAQELTQEFALRFLRGDLKGADPHRGRFRDYLKGVLFHLISDFHRRRKKEPTPLADEHQPAASESESAAFDANFLESWRTELLDRAWRALQVHSGSGSHYYQVLQFRVKNPKMASELMAQELSRLLERDVSAAWVRQTLHRARERYAELLLAEVAQTLECPSTEMIEQELAETGLHAYCKSALDKRKNPST